MGADLGTPPCSSGAEASSHLTTALDKGSARGGGGGHAAVRRAEALCRPLTQSLHDGIATTAVCIGPRPAAERPEARSCSASGIWGQGDTQVHARPAHVRGPRLAQHGPCLHHLGRPSRQVEERRCATGTTQICTELRRPMLRTTTFPSRPPAAHDSHLLPNEDHQVDNWLDSRVGWPRDAAVPLPAARGGRCGRRLSHSCSLNPRWCCPHTANSGGSAWGRAPTGRRQRRRTEP